MPIFDNPSDSMSVTFPTAQQISQSVVADPLNSFSGSLASSGCFVGVASSTLGVVGLQVSMYTDQNSSVYVEQSPDGTNWDVSDVYDYHTNIGNFGITVQAVNSYYRVIVKNTSPSDATVCRVQSVLCPIVEALPRALTQEGSLKVAIQEFDDCFGFEVKNTPSNEMRVVTPFRLVGSNFSGSTLDTVYWTAGSGSGSTLISNSQAILTTGSIANGGTSLQSVRNARYVGGNANRARIVLRLPDTGDLNNTRRWGAFTTTDGAFFELGGVTPSLVTRKGGVDTPVSNGSFNGDYGQSVSVANFNTVRTWEIIWNNTKVYFVIDGEIVHTFSANNDTWTNLMSLPLRFENNNTGGSGSVLNLNVRSAVISRLGSALSQPTSNYTSGQTAGKILKVGAGNLHSMIVGSQASTSVVTLRDGLIASDPVIFSYTYTQGAQANNQPFTLDFKGLPFSTGLFLSIETANSNVIVIYE